MSNNIIISGKFCSGKTTAANYLVNKYGYERHAFADKLKLVCNELYGDYIVNGNKPRTLLQQVGEAVRKIGRENFGTEDIWANFLFKELSEHNSSHLVIDDCRYPDELNKFIEAGWISIRLESHKDLRVQRYKNAYKVAPTDKQSEHESEVALDSARFHYYIDNDGSLSNLYIELDKIMKEQRNNVEVSLKEKYTE